MPCLACVNTNWAAKQSKEASEVEPNHAASMQTVTAIHLHTKSVLLCLPLLLDHGSTGSA